MQEYKPAAAGMRFTSNIPGADYSAADLDPPSPDSFCILS